MEDSNTQLNKAGAPYPTQSGAGGAPPLPPTSYQSSYGSPPAQPAFNPHYGKFPQYSVTFMIQGQPSAPPPPQQGYAPQGYPPQGAPPPNYPQQGGYGAPYQPPQYSHQTRPHDHYPQGHHQQPHYQGQHHQHYEEEVEYDRNGQPKKKKGSF